MSHSASTPRISTVALLGVSLCIGSLLILLNRDLMKVRQFRYPITLSGLGVTVSAVVSQICVRIGAVELQPQARELTEFKQWFVRCLPVGVCKAASLMFGNWAYMYLNMGFIQMVNCFSPVVVIAVMTTFGIGTIKPGVLPSVLAICVGTALTTTTDPSANFIGLFLVLMAILADSIAVVLTQKILQVSGLGVIEGQYVLAPAGCLALTFVAAAVEWPVLHRRGGLAIVWAHPQLFLMAGVLGLMSNFVSFKVIQATSSLTLKILNMFRGVGLVLAGTLVLHEQVTPPELLGFLVSVSGFIAYNWYSTRATDAKAADAEGTSSGPSRSPSPSPVPSAPAESDGAATPPPPTATEPAASP